jgi:Ca2+-dependent lipid-binding protein
MNGKTSDPYVTVNLSQKKQLKTKTCKKTLNPIFNETLEFNNVILDYHNPGYLNINVWD